MTPPEPAASANTGLFRTTSSRSDLKDGARAQAYKPSFATLRQLRGHSLSLQQCDKTKLLRWYYARDGLWWPIGEIFAADKRTAKKFRNRVSCESTP